MMSNISRCSSSLQNEEPVNGIPTTPATSERVKEITYHRAMCIMHDTVSSLLTTKGAAMLESMSYLAGPEPPLCAPTIKQSAQVC